MESEQASFKVWENGVYGPVDLGVLKQWVGENRLSRDGFIYIDSERCWRRAQNYEPLRELFPGGGPLTEAPLEELRQFPLFAELSDDALRQFAALGELFEPEPGQTIVSKGDHCDAVYFNLSGSLRVRLLIGLLREDHTIRTMSGGDFFGEIGVFLHTSRTADVLAETSARLFRIPTNAFQLLVKELPAIAAPVLYTIGAMLAGRMMADTERLQRDLTSQFVWR